jgi:hypothetical protein
MPIASFRSIRAQGHAAEALFAIRLPACMFLPSLPRSDEVIALGRPVMPRHAACCLPSGSDAPRPVRLCEQWWDRSETATRPMLPLSFARAARRSSPLSRSMNGRSTLGLQCGLVRQRVRALPGSDRPACRQSGLFRPALPQCRGCILQHEAASRSERCNSAWRLWSIVQPTGAWRFLTALLHV